MKYRSRGPITVDAWPASDVIDHAMDLATLPLKGQKHGVLPTLLQNAVDEGVLKTGLLDSELVVHIATTEGPRVARSGDFIVRDVKGKFYPCKPDAFADMYVEEGDAL